MADIVATLVIVLALGAAIAYIVKQKRAGVACIGCSAGRTCGKNAQTGQTGGCGCSCGCGSVERMLESVEKAFE